MGEIQEKTSLTDWYHVDTKENPADIISRDYCPSKLSNMSLWLCRPDWLVKDEENWPIISKEEILNNTVDVPEQKSSSVSVLTASETDCITYKYSSVQKMIRIVAYCMRFKTNCSKQKVVGNLHLNEINRAKIIIIKLIQKKDFQRETRQLQTRHQVSPKSTLYRLRPFLDDDGIIRVGGRLKHAATISVFQRNPIVLPAKKYFYGEFNTRRTHTICAWWPSSSTEFPKRNLLADKWSEYYEKCDSQMRYVFQTETGNSTAYNERLTYRPCTARACLS